ncbi:MAG: L-aspartate oxidase [Deltaproteobacteria bacterium]|nr:L-aspartate oxidase [Deltaproteobacteria bacterium]
MSTSSDILIIGSGISGLSLAIKLANEHNVFVVTKREAMESNTRYAQGGIASVMTHPDNFDAHIQDTLEAGSHLCDPKVVEQVVCSGPALIQELLQAGVKFAKTDDDHFDLGREGGHSERRVLHAMDLTGFEIEKKLLRKARKNPRIHFLEHHIAIDLISDRHLKKSAKNKLIYGAYILDKNTGKILTLRADVTVLATGGAGKTYLYTSNPDIATGDGIAMAYRAGCEIANLEFVQFHPTCLHDPRAKSFLISEAMRGEGGTLRLMNGKAFMKDYHKMGDLAPRDHVARAIDFELKKRGDRFVTLDMTHLDRTFLKERFPTIYKTCRRYGFDMAKEAIPVVPAAHYFCGGVRVNLKGQTALENLYAIGEVSCTGLHGANRLASNSLLEGLVYADKVAKDILKSPPTSKKDVKVRDWDPGKAIDSDEAVVIIQNWDEVRRMMWNYVGIVRSTKRLLRAKRRVDVLLEEIKEYYWDFTPTADLLELRNLARVADLTIRCALQRKESIGLNHNIDYPEPKAKSKRFNVIRKFS